MTQLKRFTQGTTHHILRKEFSKITDISVIDDKIHEMINEVEGRFHMASVYSWNVRFLLGGGRHLTIRLTVELFVIEREYLKAKLVYGECDTIEKIKEMEEYVESVGEYDDEEDFFIPMFSFGEISRERVMGMCLRNNYRS